MTDVSIVVVSYNARDFLKSCIDSVFRETRDVAFEVIVVDNASTDGSNEMLTACFPGVRHIRNPANRGFAAANNQGIAVAQGRYVLLLNADTEILDNAIRRTVVFMDAHPEAGVVGCRLIFGDGRVQHSVGMFPSLLEGFLGTSFLYLLLPKCALVGPHTISCFRYDTQKDVHWVIGAYFLTKKEVLERLGPLDEQFFVYSEEIDFCRRVRTAGFRVIFTPDATIVHHWAGISAVTRRGILWLLVSQFLYFKKYHHGIEMRLLIMLKYLGLFLRVFVYLFAGVLTFNRTRLAKSAYSAYALYRLLTTPLEYNRDPGGPVIPWTAVW